MKCSPFVRQCGIIKIYRKSSLTKGDIILLTNPMESVMPEQTYQCMTDFSSPAVVVPQVNDQIFHALCFEFPKLFTEHLPCPWMVAFHIGYIIQKDVIRYFDVH